MMKFLRERNQKSKATGAGSGTARQRGSGTARQRDSGAARRHSSGWQRGSTAMCQQISEGVHGLLR